MQTTAGASGFKCHRRRASGLADQELLTSLGFWVLLVTELVLAIPSWPSGPTASWQCFGILCLERDLSLSPWPPLEPSEQLGAVIGVAWPCGWGLRVLRCQKRGFSHAGLLLGRRKRNASQLRD